MYMSNNNISTACTHILYYCAAIVEGCPYKIDSINV